MKVLWFSPSPCSGMERLGGQTVYGGWLVSLEKELKKVPGLELEVAYLSSGNEPEDNFIYDGVRYYAIQPYRSDSYLAFRIARRFMGLKRQEEAICRRMREIVELSCPDIIHIHGTERPFGRIAEYVDVPVVYSIQGIISACAEKYYSGISRNLVRKYESLMSRIRKKSVGRDYEIFLYHAENERKFLSEASYIIGRTGWDRNITALLNPSREYFHVDEIMREPFYVAQWNRQAFGTPLQFVSVFSGGIYKGFETLLRTAKVLKDNARMPFEWTVIGYDGNENHVKIAERATGISAKNVGVRFMGRRNADEMVEIMLGTDIFCHFSHIENSPNAVCEAMLLGMPVVATAVGGTPGIVADGVDGLLVQDGEPYACAGALRHLAENHGKAAAMGKAARKRALARHDKEKICSATVDLYRNIAGNDTNI